MLTPVVSRWQAPPRRPPFPSLPLWAALIGVASVAVPVAITKWAVHDDWWFPGSGPVTRSVLLVVVGYSLILPAWWIAARATRPWTAAESIGLLARRGDWWRGAVATLACFGVAFIVAVIVVFLDLPVPKTDDRTVVRFDSGRIVLFAVTAIVIAPVFEEIAFRGLVLRGLLSKLRPGLAIVVQGVIFGAVHYDPGLGAENLGRVIILSAVGMTLGGAAYETRRLTTSIVAHALYNATIVAITLWVA